MKNIAVLTGDLIASRKVTDIEKLIASLKEIFDEVRHVGLKFDTQIYRGDSFQVVVYNLEEAFLLAVLVKIGLRSKTFVNSNKSIPIHKLWDARISVGIGAGEIQSEIVTSNGEAFQLSGLAFDKLKAERNKLTISTPWSTENEMFTIIVKLVDTIIDKWTKQMSEVAYEYLLHGGTQSEIATKIKISQPAVHKRMSSANINVIDKTISYISQYIALKK